MFFKYSLLFHLQTKVHNIVMVQISDAERKEKQEVPFLPYLGAIYCQVHA